MKNLLLISSAFILASCSPAANSQIEAQTQAPTSASSVDNAIFAGGCFWCIESDFEKLDGVIEAVSGYSGGDLQNPTYRNHKGHWEVIKVTFDTAKISYPEILDYYWTHVDPTDAGGQFCDRGHAYTTAVFARPDQIDIAAKSKADIIANKPFAADIVTPVLPAKTFWTAEDYHQDFYKKNPVRYNSYRAGCGRDRVINRLWNKKS